jgi:Zn-dependent protease with chaperone function
MKRHAASALSTLLLVIVPAALVGAEPNPNKPKVDHQYQTLKAADEFYQLGDRDVAAQLYRVAKPPLPEEMTKAQPSAQPIVNPDQLPPAGQVYWREYETGATQGLSTRVQVPLALLVEQYPQFIPGHLKLAEYYQNKNQDQQALQVLEQASNQYPNQPDLIKARIAALSTEKQWLEASLLARQFTVMNANDPSVAEFQALADSNMKRFHAQLRGRIRGNAIAGGITSILGVALLGNWLAPVSTVQTSVLLLRGEAAVGQGVAERIQRTAPLVKHQVVLNYVNSIGQRLAALGGRDEFKYDFYVILDRDLNAFALPGGKIFINAGAIVKTNSEAEFAGLVAHELAHTILSHGFQLMTKGGLTANLTQFIPYGGTISDLFTLSYSRSMERQADTLGTRMLASAGYAADGLYNLTTTLSQQEKQRPPRWLSTHPAPETRVRELARLIQQNQYNRYAYEGVVRHGTVKAIVKKLLQAGNTPSEQKPRKLTRQRQRIPISNPTSAAL